jgi:hypothetical protein
MLIGDIWGDNLVLLECQTGLSPYGEQFLMIGDKTEPRRGEEREEGIVQAKESPSRHWEDFAAFASPR